MIIDAHTHLGLNSFCDPKTEPFKYDLENTPENLIDVMNRFQIKKAVILPIPGDNYDSKLSNQYLFEAKLKYPNRFLPFCKVDDDLVNNLMERGFYGAKFHMVYETYKETKLNSYFKILEYYGFPLIIHAKFANKSDQIKKILSVAPNIKIILAHMGRGHIYTDEMIDDLLYEFKDYNNIYFESSTVGRSRMIEHACEILGANRVMFGSDFPFGKAWFKDSYLYSDDLNTIYNAKITEEEREWVFGNTILSIIQEVDMRRSGFCVRPVFQSDVQTILDKIYELSEEDRRFLAFNSKKTLIKQKIKERKHVFVAVENGNIIGLLRESGRLNNKHLLEEFIVFKDFRGMGYAKKMMEFYCTFFPNSLAKTCTNNMRMNNLLSHFKFTKIKEGQRIIDWTHNNGI